MKPSTINYPVRVGYRTKLPHGYVNFATINGDGFTVNFARISDVTCDRNNDALNGYYNVWGDFIFTLVINGKEVATLTCKNIESADKLFTMISEIKSDKKDIFDPEDDFLTAVEKVTSFFKYMKNFLD